MALNITVNGRTREFTRSVSLLELLDQLDVDARAVVVEHNREIVRRPLLETRTIQDGDQIEVVHFVGGG